MIEEYLKKVKTRAQELSFKELMDLVEAEFNFTPTAFANGNCENEAGQNSGSCKLFAFAQLYGLSKEETLACFGDYYRKDVLLNPNGEDHQNIRNFMKYGWDGIQFEGNALSPKS